MTSGVMSDAVRMVYVSAALMIGLTLSSLKKSRRASGAAAPAAAGATAPKSGRLESDWRKRRRFGMVSVNRDLADSQVSEPDFVPVVLQQDSCPELRPESGDRLELALRDR